MMMNGQQGNTPRHISRTGLILAEVTNIKDPDNCNRIKCKPVSADPDVKETDWCYCLSPMAGKDYGLFLFPKVGDLVVLGYLGGDVHNPVVLGCYWANTNTPPYKIQNGENMIRSLKTPGGIEIKLDDTDKSAKLTLTTPSGATLQVDDEKKTATLSDKDKKNGLTIAWEKGEVTVQADKKLTLKAGDGSIVLDQGAITVKASKDLKLSGANITAKGTSSLKAEAVSTQVKASGMLKLESSGTAALKGALVQIN